MAKTNVRAVRPTVTTYGGGITYQDTNLQALRRSVLSCLLWEDGFYEDGQKIADRIIDLAQKVKIEDLATLAIQARHEMHLRHVPLLLLVVMAQRGGAIVSDTVEKVITRADELSELVSLYWKLNKQKKRIGSRRVQACLSKQILLGLKKAFPKFSEYELAKYNQAKEVKLRDVLFLTNPKPKDNFQAEVWKRLANNQLKTPDTWEVELSASKDKKASWTRLLQEDKLGYLALIRNLRNMVQAGVDEKLVHKAILARRGAHRVLPFRFLAAANAAPSFTDPLDKAFLANLQDIPKLPGKTVVIIDVSGSMYAGGNLSKNSDMSRAHCGAALGAIVREIAEIPKVYATAGTDGIRVHKTEEVPAYRGLALADKIYHLSAPLGGGGIFMRQVIDFIEKREKDIDRVIVITDEQDCSGHGDAPSKAKLLGKYNYIINVSGGENGICHDKWTKINGFSENVLTYIRLNEELGSNKN